MSDDDLTVPEANNKALADRLRVTIKHTGLTLDGFAAKISVSVSGIKKWLTGAADPSFSAMTKVSRVSGVSLDWLSTGDGPMRPNETLAAAIHAQQTATDRELMGRCIDAISKLYQELNIKLPMLDMGREAADLHDEVLGSGAATIEEYLPVIRVLIAQKRRALLAAPPSGKLQDSA
jgi:transcriptional regulator with XRE-family HTH domain